MARRLGLALVCMLGTTWPRWTHAADPTPRVEPDPPLPKSSVPNPQPFYRGYKEKLRSGTVLALSLENGFGSASGYPNDSKLLNDPSYFGRTGLLGGGGFTLAVGGALAEYLTVSVFMTTSAFKNDEWSVTSGGGGLRGDWFPLTSTGNRWLQHWAFFGLVGVGAVNVKYEAPGRNVADLDGTQSFLGAGTFYEVRFGAFGLAPELRFDVVTSRTADRLALMNGLRLSFYPSRLF